MSDTIFTTHRQQEKAVDTLAELSRWMIGLVFSAGTGCMIVLQQGVSPAIKPFLVSAVVFLALSILVTIGIYLSLPVIIQQLPLKTNRDEMKSIYDHQIIQNVSLRLLTGLQISLFVLGLIFLFIWVILKPAHSG